jgi:hypothetical protein
VTEEPNAADAARILRALVTAIDDGTITAETRRERGIVRQLRGAVVALEELLAQQED